MESPTLDSAATAQDLQRRLRDLQRSARAPGIAAAIVRDGALTWSDSAGLADVDGGVVPTLDTQYAIGSITKTFTAVLLLQLRDLSRLHLDDRLGEHLRGVAHGDVTLRSLLAHLSGLRREPAAGPGGEIWETLQDPGRDELVAGSSEPAGCWSRVAAGTTRTSRSRCSARWSPTPPGLHGRSPSPSACSSRSA